MMWLTKEYGREHSHNLPSVNLESRPLLFPMRIYTFMGTLLGLFPMANVLSGKPCFRKFSFGTVMTVVNLASLLFYIGFLFYTYMAAKGNDQNPMTQQGN
jgi:hypothetical protein